MGEWALVGLGVLLWLLVVVIVAAVRLGRLRNTLETAWEQYDLAVRRRHALVDELVEAAAGLGVLSEVADRVSEARVVADFPGASSPLDQEVTELGLDRAIRALDVVIDADRAIAGDETIGRLRTRLGDAHRRVEAHRRDYDASASALAEASRRWPGRWVATSMGVGAPAGGHEARPGARPPADQ